MIRKYGETPYTTVVVHGGPGALGSVAGVAKELSKIYGIIEPMQSRHTIDGLIEELKEQIENNCEGPVTLIGHSWGAWLVGLLAERYPTIAKKVILVGSGPLEVQYVQEIGDRRKGNMSKEQSIEFDSLLAALDQEATLNKDALIKRLGELVGKADVYEELKHDLEEIESLPSDGAMYSNIWPEAAALRATGDLLERFKRIPCPVVLIQGDTDPHPYKGVVEPLRGSNVLLNTYILEKCGHTPWIEKFAYEEFYKILRVEI